jgi:methyl-accepting chemotaxis protein
MEDSMNESFDNLISQDVSAAEDTPLPENADTTAPAEEIEEQNTEEELETLDDAAEEAVIPAETVSVSKKIKTRRKRRILPRIDFHKFRQSMAFKIAVVLFLVLSLSFTALSLILNNSIKNDNIETYTTFSTSVAERTADGLTYWLESFIKDFNIFTKTYAFTSGNYETACEYLKNNKKLIDPNFDFMGFANQEGLLYDSNGNYTDISHEPFFTEIQTNGKSSYISDPYPSPDGYGYIFYISAPVNNTNNSFWGVMVGALVLSKVNYKISEAAVNQDSFTFALDSKGNIISHPDSEKIMQNYYIKSDEETGYKGYHDMVQKMLLSQKGSAIIEDGERKVTNYVFFCPINHTNWSLGIAIGQKEINATARKSAWQIAAINAVIALILMAVTLAYISFLVRPLRKLKNSIIEIASGEADLTKRIEVKSKNEIGEVVMGFNTFTENLMLIIKRIKESKDNLSDVDMDMVNTTETTLNSIRDIISHINGVSTKIGVQSQSVEETAGKVNNIASNIESLDALIENQSSGVTQASAAVEEMLGNIISVTRSTELMVQSFTELEQDTNTGIEKQNSVNEQIKLIQEQSRMLMEANKVISKIASDTNLLAMNASIEAAHAGVAGQGFSVVADEIHVLSENSGAQSKRIRDELKKIQDSITDVVNSSAEAKSAFESVTNKIHETDQLVQQIKGAMEESEIGSRQITDALKMMNDSTSDVRNASREMSDGNQVILDQVEKLQAATEEIKESMTSMTSSANEISDNSQTLTDISKTMQESIAKIGTQIDLFKV